MNSRPLLLRSYNIPTIFDDINVGNGGDYGGALMRSIIYQDYRNIDLILRMANIKKDLVIKGYRPLDLIKDYPKNDNCEKICKRLGDYFN